MHEQPRVVITGHVCLDANETEGGVYKDWGSPAMYMADQLHTLGIVPDVITSYGEDFVPYAAHVRLLPSEPQYDSTLLYRNIIRPTARLWFSENTDVALPPQLDAVTHQALASADLCVFAPLLPNYEPEYVRDMMSSVRTDATTVLCMQGYLRTVGTDSLVVPRDFPEAEAVLPLFDVAILSEEDHPRAAEMAAEWSQIPNVGKLILTRGAGGADIVCDGEFERVPTVPVAETDIQDSVGCGDVFGIGLAREYYLSGDIATAVRSGHALARHKLTAATQR